MLLDRLKCARISWHTHQNWVSALNLDLFRLWLANQFSDNGRNPGRSSSANYMWITFSFEQIYGSWNSVWSSFEMELLDFTLPQELHSKLAHLRHDNVSNRCETLSALLAGALLKPGCQVWLLVLVPGASGPSLQFGVGNQLHTWTMTMEVLSNLGSRSHELMHFLGPTSKKRSPLRSSKKKVRSRHA